MKNKFFVLLALLMLLNLTGCGKKVDGDGNLDNLSKEKPVINLGKGDSLDFDFKGEEEFLAYLVGKWSLRSLSFSQNKSDMEIDKDLNVSIRIYDFNGDIRDEFKGLVEILIDKKVISFIIGDEVYDYDFRHMTFYDDKYLMGLFHSGEESHLLEDIVDGYEKNTIDEVYFEKKVSIRYEPSPKKDASFTGIIWGHKLLNGRDMFWIGELDTSFNSSDGISNLYGFSKEIDEDILEIYYDDLFTGYAYVFETDGEGDIVGLSMEGYHHYLTGSQPMERPNYWTDKDNLVEIRREGEDYFLYYPIDNWNEVYGLDYYEGELYLEDEILYEEVSVLGLGGQVRDIAINIVSNLDQTTDDYIQPIVYFLMEDGTVEWFPAFPVVPLRPEGMVDLGYGQYSRGNLPWIQDIERLVSVEEGEKGEVLYGLSREGKKSKLIDSYNLRQVLNQAWEYPDYDNESDYGIYKLSFNKDGQVRFRKRNVLDDVELIYEGTYKISLLENSYKGHLGPLMEVNLDLVKKKPSNFSGIESKIRGVYGINPIYYGGIDFQVLEGDSLVEDKIFFQLTMAFDLDNEVEFTLWGMTKEEFTDYLLTNLPDTRSRLKDTGMTILVDGGYTHLIDLGDCRDIYLGWGG